MDGYSRQGVTIGARTKIGAGSIISCTSHFSHLGQGFRIGDDCGVSEYCYFGATGGVDIGNDVIMGQFVSFHSQNHQFEDASTKIRDQGVTSRGIRVGNNVWIGAKVTILDGTVIRDHSVIAAGAVVSGEFPDHSVIGGVPARVLRSMTLRS
ncbi:acyltransferase [Rhizomicrobium electricum]|uniref:acyltransferase n=1 Tax=Rhizomicrobium electricum TaxID=480070 RepID=UPI001ABAF376